MSDLEENNSLKVRIVRASGKKTEFKAAKCPEKHLGLTFKMVSEIEAEILYAFECALYDAGEQGKNEVVVEFNV